MAQVIETIGVTLFGFDELMAICLARADLDPAFQADMEAIIDDGEAVRIDMVGMRAIATPAPKLIALATG